MKYGSGRKGFKPFCHPALLTKVTFAPNVRKLLLMSAKIETLVAKPCPPKAFCTIRFLQVQILKARDVTGGLIWNSAPNVRV
jgi:hypothetical protein